MHAGYSGTSEFSRGWGGYSHVSVIVCHVPNYEPESRTTICDKDEETFLCTTFRLLILMFFSVKILKRFSKLVSKRPCLVQRERGVSAVFGGTIFIQAGVYRSLEYP